MPAIPSPTQLRPGDVVVHNSGAYGIITDLPDGAAEVSWIRGDAPAGRWRGAPDDAPLTLAMPGSFYARAATQPSRLVQDLGRRPIDVLELLLETFQRAATGPELRRRLLDAGVCGPSDADAWWTAVRTRLQEATPPGVTWDGHAASLVQSAREDTDAGRVFVEARADDRWQLWHDTPAEGRSALLDYSLQTGDSVASTAAVRLAHDIPDILAPRVLKRVLRGDARLGAATLLWVSDHGFDAALAAASARRDLRPLVRRILGHIHPGLQGPVLLRLLAETVQEDEPAALFLTDLLPDGPAAALMRLDSLLPDHRHQLDVRSWLEERLAESTMERPVRVADPLLTQLAPLPVERLFPVSLAVARALARRHAEGNAGGIEGARWRTPDEVVLGAPSASTPKGDVRDAMRCLAELAVGTLPRNAHLSDTDLLHHLGGLVRDIPPAWSAVLCRALDDNPDRRPIDGLDLWRHLERARATESVRQSAPIRMRQTTRYGCDTHIGALKARTGQTNQDAFWLQSEGHVTLLVVADGISVATAGSGDVASALLIQTCAQLWESWCDRLQQPSATEIEARNFLDHTLDAANRAICAAARRMAGGTLDRHIPMGTTAVLALIIGDRLHLATLGDSRAWLVGPDGAALLTGDQNLRQEWLKSWQTRQPLDLLSDGTVLTGYLGHFDDDGSPSMLPVAHRSVSLLPGETLVLSSDGLPDYAADTPRDMAILIEAAVQGSDLHAAARALVDAANAGGGGDNVTVVLARQETMV